ncbi:hypothetical protein F5887DRAFT_892119, partial [Amanita rubescens]
LLALPPDLLERILLQLDGQDVITCSLISRQFNIFIRSSIILQYRIACHAAGVVDNPHCKLSYPERHEALSKREMAWRRLQPVFTKTFDVPHVPSSLYDLTSGIYCSDVENQHLHYCSLPSTPEDVLQWNTIYVHGPNKNGDECIADMGMAINEHDLIISIVSSRLDAPLNDAVYSLSMVLLQFSTGQHHPLAQCPLIYVKGSYYRPDGETVLDISGDHVALVTGNILFIFDWKTGHKRLQHQATERAYTSLVFISPEILVVPNLTHAQFEVWKIHRDASITPYLFLNLRLPTLDREWSIFHVRCHSRPSPYLHDIPHAPPRSFYPSVRNAIIVSNVTFCNKDGRGRTVTLAMHRQSLLDAIKSLPRFTPGEYSIPWSAWGPPISRWFKEDEAQVGWITASAGQRWAVLDRGDDNKSRIRIIDFNPYNIYNFQADLPGELVIEEKGEYPDNDDIFVEYVEMGLGCIIYTAPETYDFGELLMEEERLLGLKVGPQYGFSVSILTVTLTVQRRRTK